PAALACFRESMVIEASHAGERRRARERLALKGTRCARLLEDVFLSNRRYETGRLAGATANQIRIHHQPEDRQRTLHQSATDLAGACRRGDSSEAPHPSLMFPTDPST